MTQVWKAVSSIALLALAPSAFAIDAGECDNICDHMDEVEDFCSDDLGSDDDLCRRIVDVKDSQASDFNKDLTGVRPGAFNLCATVRGITGCLDGTVTP